MQAHNQAPRRVETANAPPRAHPAESPSATELAGPEGRAVPEVAPYSAPDATLRFPELARQDETVMQAVD